MAVTRRSRTRARKYSQRCNTYDALAAAAGKVYPPPFAARTLSSTCSLHDAPARTRNFAPDRNIYKSMYVRIHTRIYIYIYVFMYVRMQSTPAAAGVWSVVFMVTTDTLRDRQRPAAMFISLCFVIRARPPHPFARRRVRVLRRRDHVRMRGGMGRGGGGGAKTYLLSQ